MTPRALTPAWALVPALAAGCADPPPMVTPEQLAAIQTVEIDTTRDEAFRAAAAVMIDRGMVIAMSDFNAGLVSSGRWNYVSGVGRAAVAPSGSLVVWV